MKEINDLLRSFWFEIVAVIIPGVVFWTLAIAFAAGNMLLWYGASYGSIDFFLNIDVLLDRLNSMELITFFHTFLLLVFSYVVGHIVYRKDIAEPDRISIWRNKSYKNEKDPAYVDDQHICEELDELHADYSKKIFFAQFLQQIREHIFCWSPKIQKKQKDVDEIFSFPYGSLGTYLERRGLSHLAEHVYWRVRVDDEIKNSKSFIGILKERIFRADPESLHLLERLEAHVRISSSVWHVCALLRRLLLYGFLATFLLFILFTLFNYKNINYNDYVVSGKIHFLITLALFNALALSFLKRIEINIERFLHYQRVREIVRILEIFDILSRKCEENSWMRYRMPGIKN